MWRPFAKSLDIWSQGAWADSVSGALSLTGTVLCSPDFSTPFNTRRFKRETLFAFYATAAAGIGPYVERGFDPIARFR